MRTFCNAFGVGFYSLASPRVAADGNPSLSSATSSGLATELRK